MYQYDHEPVAIRKRFRLHILIEYE